VFLKIIRLTLDGREGVFPIGTSYEKAVAALWPDRPLTPLAVAVNGVVHPLDEAPEANGSACILDYAQDEGRRVYERSLRFLFLVAVKAIFPEASARIEHSVHHGIYASLDRPLTQQDVRRLEAHMRQSVEEDLPFVRLRWKTDQVLEYFKAQGEMDKYRLLAGRDERYHTIYACNGLYEHFFGKLTPSARYIKAFALASYPPGVVVRLPAASEPSRPAKGDERPKLMRTFEQSARWSRILHCGSIADLNEMIRDQNIRDFIRVNEALHEKSLAEIADQIVARDARVVLVAGPSASGKTTFTNRLAIHLRVNGKRPVMLSLDEYYRNRDETPLDEEGKPDLEALDALNVPLLNEQLSQLISGETVTIPHFN
jgi:uridine kinase